MSVLMFCPQFRPVIGGTERQAEKLAAALVKSGCPVTIVTPRFDSHSPDREMIDGVMVERFQLIDLSKRYKIHGIALLNIPFMIWQVCHMMRPRLRNVTVLHCHGVSLDIAGAALAGRFANVPVVCKAATADKLSDFGKITNFSGRFVAWLVKSFVGTWVATTGAVEEALRRAGVAPERIVRIPNGVDLPSGQKDLPGSGLVRRFLYLGRLSTGANRDVPTLIRAFDRLARIHREIELAIVGGGDLLEETRQLVASCETRERIYTPGFGQSDKWLAWTDCFVLPSRREGLSNALLEAMALGLPCIANDISPNREVLEDGKAGFLVPVEDSDALGSVMQRLCSEINLGRVFGNLAFERVKQNYVIESVAENYVTLYAELSKRAGRLSSG